MDYTKNYHMPKWVKSDRIMMDDFNQMSDDIEAGLTTAAADAAQALATANNAQQTAGVAYTPSNKPYAVGAYTGNGETYREIDVGFRPSFVILCTDQRVSNTGYGGIAVLMAGASQPSLRLYMTDTGFRLDSSETVNPFPKVNERGKTYDYIAFK